MNVKSKSHFISGVIVCILGAVCFSTKAVIVKLAYRDTAIDAVTLLALRMLFSLPFFVISAFAISQKGNNVKFTPFQWVNVALIGCLGYYISSLFDFLGLQYVSAGMERLILFIYPTLVLLMSSLLLKERIKRIQWIAVGVTYGGLLLAFINEVGFQTGQTNHFLKGSLFILLCAFTYAAYIVGSGKMIPVVGATKFNSYAMSFACFAVLTHFFLTSNVSLFNLSLSIYYYSFLMAVLSTVIPSYLVTAGIKRIGSDNAAIVGSIGPVSTIIQAYFLLYEPISLIQLLGTILILAGVLIITLKKSVPNVSSSVSVQR
jgi:drug/metabolite transporter (DMT)-like permease